MFNFFQIGTYEFELECVLRIILAAFCGAIIGIERKHRLKEAGTRTHFVVAFGSALFMIVSKYGFADMIEYSLSLSRDIVKFDPTRIASTIVTGIGFLGAGTIFVRRQVINGLTTAAGLWSTAAVGMAIGAGQYILGVSCAFILVFFQWMLHSVRFFNRSSPDLMVFRVEMCDNPIEVVNEVFAKYSIKMQSVKVDKSSNKDVIVECLVKMPTRVKIAKLSDELANNPKIIGFEF